MILSQINPFQIIALRIKSLFRLVRVIQKMKPVMLNIFILQYTRMKCIQLYSIMIDSKYLANKFYFSMHLNFKFEMSSGYEASRLFLQINKYYFISSSIA